MAKRVADEHGRPASDRGRTSTAQPPATAPAAGDFYLERLFVLARLWLPIVAAVLVPGLAHLGLWAAGVTLGCPGKYAHPYSPVPALRLDALPQALLLGLVAGWATWRLTTSGARGWWPRALLLAAAAAIGWWAYAAPPVYRQQHVFNAHSPAVDGAFVVEAVVLADPEAGGSIPGYLAAFPQRAGQPAEVMHGTRVISNPPGTTLLARAIAAVVQASPRLRAALLGPFSSDFEAEALDAAEGDPTRAGAPRGTARVLARGHSAAVGLGFFVVVTALWAGAGIVLFMLGRMYFGPGLAALYGAACVITPATLMFTPGKDPAQLMTAGLPLLLWFVAVERNKRWPAALAGVTGVLACLFSLVHVWIGFVAVSATLLSRSLAHEPRNSSLAELRRLLLRQLAPAIAGGGFTALGLYALCDLDLLATARAVAGAQAHVTRGPDSMPLAWQILGVPLFFLFAGPTLWTALLWLATLRGEAASASSNDLAGDAVSIRCGNPPADSGRVRDRALGRWLLATTALVLLATVGFTNIETPRLWIPFVPLLLLGAFLQVDALRAPPRRVALAIAALVFLQVAVSAAQWTVMDVRESETRLYLKRFFGDPRHTKHQAGTIQFKPRLQGTGRQ